MPPSSALPAKTATSGNGRPVGRRSVAAQHARRRCRPAHRQDAAAQRRRLHDQDHRRGTRMPTARPAWHEVSRRVTAKDKELQAYLARVLGYALTGITTSTRCSFCYGTGAQRQGRVHEHGAPTSWRLPPDAADRDVHGHAQRAAPDRIGHAARRAPGHRNGNRRRPTLGRKQDQDAHRRRHDLRRASCGRIFSSTCRSSS